MRDTVAGAAAFYVNRLRELEGQLLVDARADVADDAMVLDGELPVMPDVGQLSEGIDWAVAEAARVAEGDFAMRIVCECLANQIGDKITDVFGADNWHWVLNHGADFTAGLGVERAMNAGLGKLGYDPEGKAATKVGQTLDWLAAQIVEGIRDANGGYRPGLRQELWTMHSQRSADARMPSGG